MPVHVHLERLFVGSGEVAALALVRRLEAGSVHDHVLRQVALLCERLHTNVASAIYALSLSRFFVKLSVIPSPQPQHHYSVRVNLL